MEKRAGSLRNINQSDKHLTKLTKRKKERIPLKLHMGIETPQQTSRKLTKL